MTGIRSFFSYAAGKTRGLSLAGRLMCWFFGASFFIVFMSSVILYWAAIHVLQWADDQVLEKRMHAMRTLLQSHLITDLAVSQEVRRDSQGPRQIFMRVLKGQMAPVSKLQACPAICRPLCFRARRDGRSTSWKDRRSCKMRG